MFGSLKKFVVVEFSRFLSLSFVFQCLRSSNCT